MKVWGRKRRLSPRGWTNIVSLEHRTLSDVLLLAVARPAGPGTYRGVAVSNETAAGKVAAARIVPMAHAAFGLPNDHLPRSVASLVCG